MHMLGLHMLGSGAICVGAEAETVHALDCLMAWLCGLCFWLHFIGLQVAPTGRALWVLSSMFWDY